MGEGRSRGDSFTGLSVAFTEQQKNNMEELESKIVQSISIMEDHIQYDDEGEQSGEIFVMQTLIDCLQEIKNMKI
jgi:hypothetical protein